MMSTPSKPAAYPLSFWAAVSLAWQLGYIIALPIVILGFGGAYADKAMGTSPWILLTGIALSLLVSCIGVWRKIRAIASSL